MLGRSVCVNGELLSSAPLILGLLLFSTGRFNIPIYWALASVVVKEGYVRYDPVALLILIPDPHIFSKLKGLSHVIDLAFDDMHGQFKAYIGDAASF